MRRAAALFSLLLFLPTLAAAIDLGGLLNNLSKIDKNTVNTVKQAVVPADEQQEQQYGYSAAATLLGAARPIQNADVQNYVNKVGLWVALHSDRPNLPWHFAVVDSNDIDAFAAPYGYVFITRGLLFHMRSEAELAGVLGHEISHVVLKHHLKALQQAAQMQLVGQAVQSQAEQRGYNGQVVGAVANASRNLYSKGLDKDDEFDADRMGVVLALRAGYDPYGLLAVLQTLEAVDPSSSQMQLLMATHPSPADRIARLTAAMNAGRLDRYGNLAEGTDRFVNVVKELVPAPAASTAAAPGSGQ